MEPYTKGYSQPSQSRSPFIITSLICGVLAFFTICTVILPFIFGSLSILFAVLSHRKGEQLETPALSGVIASSIAMVFSFVMIVVTIISLPTLLQDEEYRAQLNATSEAINGVSFDELFEQNGIDLDALFGIDSSNE